jgi:hypothetical protein
MASAGCATPDAPGSPNGRAKTQTALGIGCASLPTLSGPRWDNQSFERKKGKNGWRAGLVFSFEFSVFSFQWFSVQLSTVFTDEDELITLWQLELIIGLSIVIAPGARHDDSTATVN